MRKVLDFFFPAILVLLFLFTIVPSLKLSFSLIDDSDFAQKYLATKDSLVNFLTTFPGIKQGRLTPTFWTIFIGRFALMGFNPQLHHLFHILEIGLIFGLLWLVVKKLTNNETLAHFSCLSLLLISPGVENWYRISTQEPGQMLTLLLLILIVLNQKKFNWKIPLLTVIFLFSKEVSFLLTPIFFVWWLIEKNKKEKKKLFHSWISMAVLSLMFLIVLWLINRDSIWAGNNASLSNVLPSLKSYWQIAWRLWIPQMLLVSIPIIFLLNKDEKIRKTSIVFLAWISLDFLALLPWKYPLARLMGTMVVGVAVILAITTYLVGEKTFHVLKVRKLKELIFLPVSAVFLLLLVKFSYVNFLDSYNTKQTYLAWEISNGNFLKELSRMPENSQVVVNVSRNHFNAHEWVVMMPEHLDIFYNRADIEISFVDEENLEVKNPSYLTQWSVYNLPLEKNKNELIWKTEVKAKLISTSLTGIVKKVIGLNKLPIFQEKIYSWQIYEN